MPREVAQEWTLALQTKRSQLNGSKYSGIIDELDYATIEAKLIALKDGHGSDLVTRCLNKLRPAFEQLNLFTESISTFIQADANPVGIVWGSIQAVVICACEFWRTLEDITTMLQGLTFTTTRVNRYIKLLPRNRRLQTLTREIVEDYVQFCIFTIKFYKRSAALTLGKVLWWGVRKDFQKTQQRIETNITTFEKEARADIDEIVVAIHGELEDRLPNAQHIITSIPTNGVFDVPYSKNQYFRGRTSELDQIHKRLSPKQQEVQSEPRSCLIHAMGGMGKTQIALEYAYRNRRFYHCIFWLGSQRAPELAVGYASIASKLGITGSGSMGLGRKIELVREWFETTDKTWLLIFDNTELWDTIQPYWPRNCAGAIVVTSQMADLAQVIRSQISIQSLGPEEGTALFLDLLQKDRHTTEEYKAALEISERVGGLPITIAHIAGYLFTSRITLPEALDKFKAQQTDDIWTSRKTWSSQMYFESLDMVWSIALDELWKDGEEASDVLYVLSMLSPDSIPESLFVQSLGSSPDIEFTKQRLFERIRSSLCRRQLVQRDTSTPHASLSLHRSLQLNLRIGLSKDILKRQEIFDQAVMLVRTAFPRQSSVMSPDNRNWDRYEIYQPHVLSLQAVLQQSQPALRVSTVLASLLSDEANYFWERNFQKDGIEASKLAVKILDGMSEPDLNDQAQAHCLWGVMELENGISGRHTGLEELIKTLNIRKQFIDSPPPGGTPDQQLLYANAWNDFGCGLLEFADYAVAEQYLEHALAIKKRNTNKKENPMMFAEAYVNLSVVRASQERFDEAKDMMTEAIQLAERHNGWHGAQTQNFRFLKAIILLLSEDSADLTAAKDLHLDILEERTNLFGTFSFRARHSYYALGVTYYKLREYEEAEKMLRLSLANLEQNPCTEEYSARSQYFLAQMLKEQHRQKEAVELDSKAQDIRDKLFPKFAEAFQGELNDQMQVYEYMVSYKAGRTRIGRPPVRPLEIEDTGIDASIVEFGRHDSQLRNPALENEA
ncbi:hypothetical protein MMC26_000437 [Xylographa opegraphella]|nr:hypothetical protein [Xylographa opegraphella]